MAELSIQGRVPRILIADDEPVIRDLVRVTLQLGDYEVVGEATDGTDAVNKARDLFPDIVILDYMMPDMNGETAAMAIRAFAPEIKIVAFSALPGLDARWADLRIDKHDVTHIAARLKELDLSHRS